MSRLVTDHLPLLAGAPNGVKRLRELILELAVRGKLVQQETADIPAKNLLAAIHSERTRLVKSKIIKAGKTSSENEGYPFPLPDGWSWTNLYELCSIRGGCTPSMAKSKYWDGEIPWVSPKDMHAGAIVDSELKITETALQESSLELVPVGSVLIVGRSGILKRKLPAQITSVPCTVNQDLKALTPIAPLSSTYLRLMLLGTEGDILKNDVKTGTTVQSLVFEKLFARKFGLPPQAEQDRIIAKVDELMALCDRLETRQSDAQAAHARLVDELLGSLLQARDAEDFAECWGRVKGSFDVLFTTEPSIDALKQAVLQLAVTGRLVKSEQDSAGGWITQRIEEFCTVQGGIQKTPLRRPVSQHFPYLRVLNVQRNRINVAELERYELTLDELDRWRLNAGDLLIVEGNGSENEIGRCAIWNGEVDDCVYQNHLMRVRPHEPRCVVYLALYLNSPEGMAHMRRLAITTSGLFNLSVGKIRSIPVAMPSLAEQQRIVAKVDGFITLCDQLKNKTVQARALNESLAKTMAEQAISKFPLCQDGI
jgi:type I restriction enzyme S subunit